VVALDTNVVVRILVGDDPVQTKKAERVFLEHTAGDGVFISLVVLAEVAWVLKAGYEWEREVIHARLDRLMRTRGVAFEDLDLVQAALEEYARGKAEFADCLIVGKARGVGATLLTFDRRLARAPGVTLLA
jgi:predicted nucleic-acid-binding protein